MIQQCHHDRTRLNLFYFVEQGYENVMNLLSDSKGVHASELTWISSLRYMTEQCHQSEGDIGKTFQKFKTFWKACNRHFSVLRVRMPEACMYCGATL